MGHVFCAIGRTDINLVPPDDHWEGLSEKTVEQKCCAVNCPLRRPNLVSSCRKSPTALLNCRLPFPIPFWIWEGVIFG